MEPPPSPQIPQYVYDDSGCSRRESGNTWPASDEQTDFCARLIAVCPQSEPIPSPPLEIPQGMVRIYISHFDKIPVKHRGCWTCHDFSPEQKVVELFMGHFYLGGVEPFAAPPAQPNPRLATALHQVGELKVIDGEEEFTLFPPGKECKTIPYEKESSLTIKETGWINENRRIWLTLTMGINGFILHPKLENGNMPTAA